MNERIKQFADEAAKFSAIMALPTGESGDELFVEKFAELIVRECSDIAYQSLYEDRVFDDSPHNIRCNVMDAIKKHFGVEE